MPITLHIEAESIGDLIAKANAALSGLNVTVSAVGQAVEPPAVEAPKTRTRKADEPKPPEPVVEATATVVEPKTEVENPPSELSYELHIKPAVLELANAKGKGREVVVALLSDWQEKTGWTAPENDAEAKFRASDVPAEHFPAFYADIQSRLAA